MTDCSHHFRSNLTAKHIFPAVFQGYKKAIWLNLAEILPKGARQIKMYHFLKKSNPCKSLTCKDLKINFVELEGFEPSSKRGTNELSTCVVSSWFSSCGRPETTNRGLIL